MQENVTIKVTQGQLINMKSFYKDYLVENNGEYIYFQANVDGLIVTGFSSSKEMKSVYFSGEGALNEAKIWDKTAKLNQIKEKQKEEWLILTDQIGSDECGVADFIGPMIVVATYVKESDVDYLKKLGVHDSKKLTDEMILKIVPKLIKRIHFSKLTLPNEKYNELEDNEENLNSMKAKMHNRALHNLLTNNPNTKNICVDQFCEPSKYYSYLNDKDEPIVKNIVFKTKGESFFPCVAAASVIARFSFIQEMNKLSKKYGMIFPYGASGKVNDFAKRFIKKYGIEEFNKICKRNFKNYKEIISTL